MENPSNSSNPSRKSPEPKFAAFIGIDWAHEKHAYALAPADGSPVERGELMHTPEALSSFAEQLRNRFGGQPIAVALELSRGPLVWALAEHSFLRLYPVTPQSAAELRRVLHPSGAKSDPADAVVILKMLLHHRDRLRPLRLADAQSRLLDQLSRDRRDAVEERTRCQLRLEAALDEYFPLAFDILGPLKNDASCKFLLKYGSLPELQDAPLHCVRKFLHGLNCRQKIEERLALIAPAKPLTSDPAVIESGRRKVRLLGSSSSPSTSTSASMRAGSSRLFKDHPDRPLFDNLPGAGDSLAPRLLCSFGLDRARFASAAELSAYSGIAPIQISSGKSKFHQMRIGCPKFLRQTFHEFAAQAVRFCPWSREYYNAQMAKGKKHHQAVRSLAFKWQRILFRCWLTNTPYNEAKYLEALRKSGSVYALDLKEAA